LAGKYFSRTFRKPAQLRNAAPFADIHGLNSDHTSKNSPRRLSLHNRKGREQKISQPVAIFLTSLFPRRMLTWWRGNLLGLLTFALR